MSNEDAIHELYEQRSAINFDRTHILLEKATIYEKDFMRLVTDFVLQQSQKKALQKELLNLKDVRRLEQN